MMLNFVENGKDILDHILYVKGEDVIIGWNKFIVNGNRTRN